MNIRRMTATYGKLDHQTLLLADGLTFIHAPNESGKSTWSSFLQTMLYGINTRDRSPLADKIRRAPWSGAAMEGLLEVETPDGSITLTRQTSRKGSPMGSFSACYTGTANPVPALSAANCGEALLGIPQEIYVRSAFIGQGGGVIDQTSSLERRIASLISTGEESSSFSEAHERLKKQLTRRRYHRSGLLPTLESELASIEARQRQADSLCREREDTQSTISLLEEEEARLAKDLEAHERLATLENRRTYSRLLDQLDAARAEVSLREADAAGLPSKAGLIGLKSAAGSAVLNQMSKKRLEDQLAHRQQETEQAQAELSAYPLFRELTGTSALEKAEADRIRWQTLLTRGRRGRLLLATAVVGAALLAPPLALGLLPLWPGGLVISLPLTVATAGVLLIPAKKQAVALAAAYNAVDESGFSAYAQQYDTLYSIFLTRRQEEAATRTRLEGLTAAIDSSIEQLLAGVRIFSPEATDLTAAVGAIDRAMARLERLEEARRIWDETRVRCETLEEALSTTAPLTEEEAVSPPSQPQEELQTALTGIRAKLESHKHRLALLQGQLHSTGDPIELEARRQELEAQRQTAALEYDAIAAAMAELESANTDLQNRFSPALGAEAGKILSRLTAGRYHTVLLDRTLAPQAESHSDLIPRAAPLLSGGTSEQLYLAVRLALCRMILPADNPPPLILDDALVSFDDQRLALALDVLREEAKTRQILLFTCQERELRWAEGKDDVHVIRLSPSGGIS